MTANPAPPPDRAPVVKLTGPTDLVAAVPHLLGFRPQESVVVMAERGPRHRIAFTLRLDLPDPGAAYDRGGGWDVELGAVVTPTLAQQPDGVLVAVFTAAPLAVDRGLPWRGFVQDVRDRFEQGGVRVSDAVCVSQGRWWSYLCSNPECCPPAGTPVHEPGSRVEAQLVFEGSAPLADRGALVTLVRPPSGISEVSLAQAFERAATLADDPSGAGAGADAQLAAWRAALTSPPAPGDHQAWAGLVGPLERIPVRDMLLAAVAADPGPWIDLLSAACRRTPRGYGAPVATVLGAAAYSLGNGALAKVALDRALADRPTYSMARLLLHVLAGAVPPEQLRAGLGAFGRRR